MSFEVEYQNSLSTIKSFENLNSRYSSFHKKFNSPGPQKSENFYEKMNENNNFTNGSSRTETENINTMTDSPNSLKSDFNQKSYKSSKIIENKHEQLTEDVLMENISELSSKTQSLKNHLTSSNESLILQDEFYQEEEIGPDKLSFLNKKSDMFLSNDENEQSNNEEDLDTDTATEDKDLYELDQLYRIIQEVMSNANKHVNWPFIDAVDSNMEGCFDYYDCIKKPMWLNKIAENLEQGKYEGALEVVNEFQLIVDNCYLFNGVLHPISKKASKLQMIFFQKINQLPSEIKGKVSLSPTYKTLLEKCARLSGAQQQQDSKLSYKNKSAAARERMKLIRQQQITERRLEMNRFVESLVEWDETLFLKPCVIPYKSMWELPQIGLFLFLCSSPLNLDLSQYELERCFLLSRQSSSMQRLMTSLLTSASQRNKLHLGELMPARVWHDKLKDLLDVWYKSLQDYRYDLDLASDKVSIDPSFYKVLGLKNPLIASNFHDLSYYQKVWIVKSICDHLLDTQKSLLECIDTQDIIDLRAHDIGCDTKGNHYLYFSQFCGDDVRIYKQTPLPTIEVKVPDLDQYKVQKKTNKLPTKKILLKKSKKFLKGVLNSAYLRSIKRVKIPTVASKSKKTTSDQSSTPRSRDSRLRQNPRKLKSYKTEDSASSVSDDEEDGDDEGVCLNESFAVDNKNEENLKSKIIIPDKTKISSKSTKNDNDDVISEDDEDDGDDNRLSSSPASSVSSIVARKGSNKKKQPSKTPTRPTRPSRSNNKKTKDTRDTNASIESNNEDSMPPRRSLRKIIEESKKDASSVPKKARANKKNTSTKTKIKSNNKKKQKEDNEDDDDEENVSTMNDVIGEEDLCDVYLLERRLRNRKTVTSYVKREASDSNKKEIRDNSASVYSKASKKSSKSVKKNLVEKDFKNADETNEANAEDEKGYEENSVVGEEYEVDEDFEKIKKVHKNEIKKNNQFTENINDDNSNNSSVRSRNQFDNKTNFDNINSINDKKIDNNSNDSNNDSKIINKNEKITGSIIKIENIEKYECKLETTKEEANESKNKNKESNDDTDKKKKVYSELCKDEDVKDDAETSYAPTISGPEEGRFMMVADSIQGIRDLIKLFQPPEFEEFFEKKNAAVDENKSEGTKKEEITDGIDNKTDIDEENNIKLTNNDKEYDGTKTCEDDETDKESVKSDRDKKSVSQMNKKHSKDTENNEDEEENEDNDFSGESMRNSVCGDNEDLKARVKKWRKSEEGKLHGKLSKLLQDLQPHEEKLLQALNKKRRMLKEEESTYQEPIEMSLEEKEYDHFEQLQSDSQASDPDYDPKTSNEEESSHRHISLETIAKIKALEKKKCVKTENEQSASVDGSVSEMDLNVAMLLSEGRVLRKRHNQATSHSPQNTPVKKSRRSLTRACQPKNFNLLFENTDNVIAEYEGKSQKQPNVEVDVVSSGTSSPQTFLPFLSSPQSMDFQQQMKHFQDLQQKQQSNIQPKNNPQQRLQNQLLLQCQQSKKLRLEQELQQQKTKIQQNQMQQPQKQPQLYALQIPSMDGKMQYVQLNANDNIIKLLTQQQSTHVKATDDQLSNLLNPQNISHLSNKPSVAISLNQPNQLQALKMLNPASLTSQPQNTVENRPTSHVTETIRNLLNMNKQEINPNVNLLNKSFENTQKSTVYKFANNQILSQQPNSVSGVVVDNSTLCTNKLQGSVVNIGKSNDTSNVNEFIKLASFVKKPNVLSMISSQQMPQQNNSGSISSLVVNKQVNNNTASKSNLSIQQLLATLQKNQQTTGQQTQQAELSNSPTKQQTPHLKLLQLSKNEFNQAKIPVNFNSLILPSQSKPMSQFQQVITSKPISFTPGMSSKLLINSNNNQKFVINTLASHSKPPQLPNNIIKLSTPSPTKAPNIVNLSQNTLEIKTNNFSQQINNNHNAPNNKLVSANKINIKRPFTVVPTSNALLKTPTKVLLQQHISMNQQNQKQLQQQKQSAVQPFNLYSILKANNSVPNTTTKLYNNSSTVNTSINNNNN